MAARGLSFDGLGNRALLSLLRSGSLQRKARLSQPGDSLEHEADRAADKVVSGTSPSGASLSQSPSGEVQRMPTEDQKLAMELGLGSIGGSVDRAEPTPEPDRADTQAADLVGQLYGGRRLDERTRGLMESRFGENFSDVRVHTGHRAGEAADSVQARAFTVREDIVFAEGQYAPETTNGQRLLAHELAHVVQQRQPTGGVASEREAERDARDAAHELTSGGAPTVRERARPGIVQKQETPQKGSHEVTAQISISAPFTFTVWVDGFVVAYGEASPFEAFEKSWSFDENTSTLTVSVTAGGGGVSHFAPSAARGMLAQSDHGVLTLADARTESRRYDRAVPPPVEPPPVPVPQKPRQAPQKPKPKKVTPSPPSIPPATVIIPEIVIGPDEDGPDTAPSPQEAERLPAERKPAAAPEPANASELIDKYTSMGNLDEDALGKALLNRALAGDTATVDATLEELDSTDRDDVSLALTSQATDDQLDQLAETEEGRKLLLRLFDELTSGYVVEEEGLQADRVMKARAKRIDPKKFIEAEQKAMVIPFSGIGMTKFSSASLSVERLPNGKIWVRSHMKPEHWKDAKRLPSVAFAYGQGREFDPDEVVGLYLYDEGGKTVYVPAIVLLQLSNQETSKAVSMMGEAVIIGLTLGAGSGAAAGGETVAEQTTAQVAKRYALRALNVADWTATGLGAASTLIDDHRGLILQHFGKDGEEFLKHWSTVERVIEFYGLARGAFQLGQTAASLRSSLQKWRSLQAELKGLSAEETQALDQIAQQTEKTLDELDQAQRAQGPRPKLEPPTDRYDAEAWKAYYEQNPNAGRSVGAASVDDPSLRAETHGEPHVVTDLGKDHEVLSTVEPDGTVRVTYGDKSTTISLIAKTGNNPKLARELGISTEEATQVLQEIHTAVGRPRKVLISFAQDTGNAKAYLQQRLRDPLGRLESDAFDRPPKEQTRLDARIGAGEKRLSRYALVFEEETPGQFTPKTSKTTAVTEYQFVDPQTGARMSGASVRPRAVVRVNESGEIVEIVDHTMPGASAEEARAKVVDLFRRQGWVVKLD
jgi:hypothetical protein